MIREVEFSKIEPFGLLFWDTYLHGQLLDYDLRGSSLRLCYNLGVLDQWGLGVCKSGVSRKLSVDFPFLSHLSLYAWTATIDLTSHFGKTWGQNFPCCQCLQSVVSKQWLKHLIKSHDLVYGVDMIEGEVPN